ncbi:MAG TPA: GNAT family N-acetyltransferase [Caldilineaceae bacterium]|nr:GNAT family N-acetyltransferase [Caldilineaceae bacterium]
MNYAYQPLIHYPIPEIASVLTQGFSGYFVPIKITPEALLQMARQLSLDFTASYMVCHNAHPVGVALVGRRGWSSRLAAMSILPDHRGQGAGTYLLEQLISDSKARGEKAIVLEVIEQNEPAVKLYRKFGFATVRRLTGYAKTTASPAALNQPSLQEIDLPELARHVLQYGPINLPWQLSGETLGNFSLPTRAYQLDSAMLALSDPTQPKIVIYSLLTLPDARGNGKARQIVEAAMAQFQQREWIVPALCPEEFGGFFAHLGFTKGEISQLQMSLPH